MKERSPTNHRVSLREVAAAWMLHHVVRPLCRRPLLPRSMHMLATGKCHARCIMCGIWKADAGQGEDLTCEQWGRIFADRLFSKLQFTGVSGGEPFLRPDLPDLLMRLHRHAQHLKRFSITTSGTVPDLMEKTLERLAPYCRENGLLLDISVSMHGLGKVFEKINGVPHAFEKALKTFEILKGHLLKDELTMSINAVLLRENLHQARELAAWAQKQEIPISFVVGEQRMRFFNEDLGDAFVPDTDRGKLLTFLKEMGRDLTVRKLHSLRYRDLAGMMEKGKKRTLPCYYALGGFILGHDAQLYYCSHSSSLGHCSSRSAWDIYYDPANLSYRRQELLGRECRVCPPYTLTRWEIEVHTHRILGQLLMEGLRRSRP